MNRWVVLSFLGVLFVGCGGDDGGGGSSTCQGTVEGEISGAFTCQAVANYFPNGGGLTEDRKNGLVTVLNNEFDKTHTRPSGIKAMGTNIEIVGEPKAGTFPKESTAFSGTRAYVNFSDTRGYTLIKAVNLVLTEVTFANDSTLMDITSKVYNIHGSVDYTVASDDGTKTMRVQATF